MRHGWIDNKTEPHGSVAIVEDERISRKALTALLSDQGYETTAFASAEEMLDWIDHELPKVLLVDVDLPGMSGLQLVTLLEQRFPDVCAVLITAAGALFAIPKHEADRCNAEAYLRKPLNLQQLLSLLSQRQLCH